MLQSLTVPGSYDGPDIVVVGEKRYLCFIPREDTGIRYMYRINKSVDPANVSIATAPKRVSISPRMVDRSQDISVVAKGSGVREVVVTNAGGQVVYSTKVIDSENSVKINSRHLSFGLNIVSVKGADGKDENCKVIVKK